VFASQKESKKAERQMEAMTSAGKKATETAPTCYYYFTSFYASQRLNFKSEYIKVEK
jgi:hypothetical protein